MVPEFEPSPTDDLHLVLLMKKSAAHPCSYDGPRAALGRPRRRHFGTRLC